MSEVELSYWNIIISALSAQGFFLVFLILMRKSKASPGRLYMGLFIFVFSIILLLWLGFWNDYPIRHPHFNYLYDPIPLLLGPLFLFFIKTQFERLQKNDIVHILPFVLSIIWYMPFYLLSADQKYHFINNPGGNLEIWRGGAIALIMHALHVLSLITYSVLIHLYLNIKRLEIEGSFNKSAQRMLSYIKYLFSAFSMLYALHFFTKDLNTLPVFFEYTSTVLIGVIFYIIGYLSLSFSPLTTNSRPNVSGKYSRSGLDRSNTEYMMNRIVRFIEQKKPYLIESYKLSDLSSDIDIPSHHISELLNKYYNKNFADLINRYRILEAKRLLVSKEYENKTVSAIGYDVGFSSRTTFHNWFKKITGQSPSAYQKRYKVCSE